METGPGILLLVYKKIDICLNCLFVSNKSLEDIICSAENVVEVDERQEEDLSFARIT